MGPSFPSRLDLQEGAPMRKGIAAALLVCLVGLPAAPCRGQFVRPPVVIRPPMPIRPHIHVPVHAPVYHGSPAGRPAQAGQGGDIDPTWLWVGGGVVGLCALVGIGWWIKRTAFRPRIRIIGIPPGEAPE